MGLSVELEALLTAARDGRLSALLDVAAAKGVRELECGGLRLKLGPAEPADDERPKAPDAAWTKDEMFGHTRYEPKDA